MLLLLIALWCTYLCLLCVLVICVSVECWFVLYLVVYFGVVMFVKRAWLVWCCVRNLVFPVDFVLLVAVV